MLAVSVLLARSLGTAGYGVYAYAFALVELLGLPGQLGIQTLIVREVARFRQRELWGQLRGVLRFGVASIVTTSAVIMLGVGLFTWLSIEGALNTEQTTLLWAVVLLPVVSLMRLYGAGLRGLKSIVKGLVPENIIHPGGFLLLCAVALLVLPASWLTADRAMLLHVAAALVTLLLAGTMLLGGLPAQAREAKPEYDLHSWIAAALPLTLITGMQIINSRADMVMLRWFGSPDDVGVYRVVVDSSVLVLFGLKAINMAVAPHFAALWTAEDRCRLQRLVTVAARVSFGFACPLGLLLLFFGEPILTIVFGRGFASGSVALAIMVVGQVINAAFGSIVLLLNMTGNERMVARGIAVAVLTNVGLNLVLIPIWGIEGAATTTVVTVATWNSSLWWAARRRLGIDSLAFRRLSRTHTQGGQ